MNDRFQLRHAAGIYWLLDMEQEIGEYKEPLMMNETGAEIYRLLNEGKTENQIIEILAGRYSSKPEDIRKDITGFEMHLKNFGFVPKDSKEAE